jgi:UDP-galactose transporter B1
MADGFLPDFQAVIKTVYKPPAIVMLEMVNKWATIICLIFTFSTGHLVPIFNFILTHNRLIIDLALIGILSAAGQFFVYYLCNVFKQHIVPLIVGTRKIFTVALSIFYYGHDISIPQILGLLIVLGISLYEFFAESQIKQ